MDIAVTGEGVTDYGKKKFGQDEWEDGPVQVYLYRIARDNGVDVRLGMIERAEVEKIQLQGRSIRGLNGKSIPARKFKVLCKEKGYNYGIYYCDTDRESGAKNSDIRTTQKSYDAVYNDVVIGLDSADKKFIPMIPCRMIENWILADKVAINQVYGQNEEKYSLTNIEAIWGDKKNAQSNYPKCITTRLHNNSKRKDIKDKNVSEIFVDIANVQNMDTLEKNCSISFRRFREDYEKLLEHSLGDN